MQSSEVTTRELSLIIARLTSISTALGNASSVVINYQGQQCALVDREWTERIAHGINNDCSRLLKLIPDEEVSCKSS